MKTVTLLNFYGKELLAGLFQPMQETDNQYGYCESLLNNEFVEGFMRYAHLGDIIVTYQEWILKSPFQLRIAYQKELLKIQFEIEGDSLFLSTDNETINIPNAHYQYIYIPKADGHLQYNSSRKVLDLYIPFDQLMEFLSSQGLCKDEIHLRSFMRKYTFFRSAMHISPRQTKLINELLFHSYSVGFAKDYIRIKALELILSVFKENEAHQEVCKWRKEDRVVLFEIKNYLDTHFQNEIHLKSISRHFGINEFKLKKAFKDLFYDTVINYVRKQRLKHAHNLLLHSSLDIKEIAFESGFKYPHHFSQVYLRHYQKLPRDTRREIGH